MYLYVFYWVKIQTIRGCQHSVQRTRGPCIFKLFPISQSVIEQIFKLKQKKNTRTAKRKMLIFNIGFQRL